MTKTNNGYMLIDCNSINPTQHGDIGAGDLIENCDAAFKSVTSEDALLRAQPIEQLESSTLIALDAAIADEMVKRGIETDDSDEEEQDEDEIDASLYTAAELAHFVAAGLLAILNDKDLAVEERLSAAQMIIENGFESFGKL